MQMSMQGCGLTAIVVLEDDVDIVSAVILAAAATASDLAKDSRNSRRVG